MNNLKCERCGYILNERDDEPMYQVKKIRWTDNERSIILCRFCNNDLDNFLRGFPIWATSEFKETSERYQGKISEDTVKQARYIIKEYESRSGKAVEE